MYTYFHPQAIPTIPATYPHPPPFMSLCLVPLCSSAAIIIAILGGVAFTNSAM